MDPCSFWNERYKDPEIFAYGKEANDFLKESLKSYIGTKTVDGELKALCLCEGEGRNAMHLAKEYNYKCDCIDLSQEGMSKLKNWASEENLSDNINTIVGNLQSYDIKENEYDLIISISAHTPSFIRKSIHSKINLALKKGGYFILEAYTPDNIGRGTGGPQEADMCMTKEGLDEEIINMKTIHLASTERDVSEGIYHSAKCAASVVQYIGIKE